MQRLIGLTVVCFLLSACAGTTKPVGESQKDNSGAFDGSWDAIAVKTTSTQRHLDWNMNCSKPFDSFGFQVAEGELLTSNDTETITTFVNKDGRFRLEIPIQQEMSESIGSDVKMSAGQITLIMQGNLSESALNGKFIVGVAELGNTGCTSSVKFRKNW